MKKKLKRVTNGISIVKSNGFIFEEKKGKQQNSFCSFFTPFTFRNSLFENKQYTKNK